MIENGANIHLKDEEGNTALRLACRKGYTNIAKLLFSKGAKIHERIDSNMDSALHVASRFGRMEIVDFLLNNGVDLNTRNLECKTALFLACEHGSKSVVQCLIEKERVST